MKKIADTIWKGLEPDLLDFVEGLNWTYIIMFTIALYGITYKKEFNWFNRLMVRAKVEEYTVWIAGIIIGSVFSLFKWLEDSPPISWSYVSSLLRSWLLVVVFAYILIDGVVRLLKFLGSAVDDKQKKTDG